VSVGLLQQT